MTHILHDLIKNEQRRIQRLINLAASSDVDSRVGSLAIDTRGDSMYCYENIFEKGKRAHKTYLGTPGSEKVRAHCGVKYRRELLRRLRLNLKLLDAMECSFSPVDPPSVISALPSTYSRLPKEMFVDERYEELKAWAAADYPRNTMQFPKASNYARDGKHTRSKGESIVYNLLLEMGIPTRYDCLMNFSNNTGHSRTLSPDFLIQCYDGSFVIIEHLGYIGDKKYALDYGEKCYWYLQKGFVPGKNFLVTCDDLDGGTDSRAIATTLSRVEQLFWGY